MSSQKPEHHSGKPEHHSGKPEHHSGKPEHLFGNIAPKKRTQFLKTRTQFWKNSMLLIICRYNAYDLHEEVCEKEFHEKRIMFWESRTIYLI